MSTTPPTAREIFLDLIELDAATRQTRIIELRQVDASLAEAVEAMLTAPTATVVGPPPSQDGVLAPGTTVGPLKIVSLLGRGGMGEVYLAEDDRLDRRVALKAIRGGLRERPRSRARFLREARILSSLEHPGICRIYDYIETDDGDFIVLELIDGVALNDGTWPTKVKLALAEQLARTLAVAHAAGVVHRDLKPANVMVTPADEVKVLDFGIARMQRNDDDQEDGAPAGTLVTQQGAITGTPMYMSPEQAAGETVTAASDMYSFGLVLQELLTGRLPREDSDPETVLILARQGERRAVRGIDADVAALIRKLTARRPADRPTATETALRLVRIRTKTRRRLTAGAIAAVVLVLIGGTVKYTVDLARERSIAVTERREVEETMSFILEDLKPQLDEVGRLVALQGAADRVVAYYSKRQAEDLSDRDVLLFARGLQLMAEVRIKQGELDEATEALQQERALLDRLLASNPDDAETLFAQSQWCYFVGDIAFRQGNPYEAAEHFTAYRETASRLVELEPDNPDWALERAYATSSLASMYGVIASREPERRDEYVRLQTESRDQSLRLKRAIVADHPEFGKAVLSLANDLSFRSGQRDAACDATGAQEDAAEAVVIVQQYVELSPDDSEARYRLCMALGRRASLARSAGDLEQALSLYRRMQAEARTLVDLAPDNVMWLQERAYGFMLEGSTLVDLDRHDEAERVLRTARGYLEDLSRRGSTLTALRGMAYASQAAAQSALSQDDANGALLAAQSGLESIDDYTDPKSSMAKAWLWIEAGRAHQGLGDQESATHGFHQALKLVEPAPDGIAEVTAIRAMALLRLGRADDAARHLDWLANCNGVPVAIAKLARTNGLDVD